MSKSIVLALALFLAFGTASAAEGCQPVWPVGMEHVLETGSDKDGYYIRSNPRSVYGLRPIKLGVDEAAEELARGANAIVVYIGSIAENPVAGAWRGRTAFEAVKALAEAGGLAAVAPKPDFWIVGQRRFVEMGKVQIFAYPIDPSGQRTPWAKDIEGVEKSLVAQLPVRALGSASTLQQLMLGYYWLPEEGGDTLLAVASGPFDTIYRPSTVFKVKLSRTAGEIKVECLWGAQTSGYLAFGISEDFDGDGYRDFVFGGGEDWPDEIVSGKDGHILAKTFATSVLAVEKNGTGPKRFAADGVWESPGSGARVFRYSEAKRAFAVPGLKATRNNPEAMRSMEAATSKPERSPVKVLAKELGSAEGIRLYVMPGMAAPTPAETLGAEVVQLQRPNFGPFITAAQIEAGSPAHVLYEYKSPGYLAWEEKRKQAAARN